jgi:hypothetical protein
MPGLVACSYCSLGFSVSTWILSALFGHRARSATATGSASSPNARWNPERLHRRVRHRRRHVFEATLALQPSRPSNLLGCSANVLMNNATTWTRVSRPAILCRHWCFEAHDCAENGCSTDADGDFTRLDAKDRATVPVVSRNADRAAECSWLNESDRLGRTRLRR